MDSVCIATLDSAFDLTSPILALCRSNESDDLFELSHTLNMQEDMALMHSKLMVALLGLIDKSRVRGFASGGVGIGLMDSWGLFLGHSYGSWDRVALKTTVVPG